MMLIAGAGLLVLGLVCGAALTAAPWGLLPGPADLTLWVLFPAFTLGGLLMAALGTASQGVAWLCRLTGGLLVLLALLAAAGLVLGATGMAPLAGTGALWYVLAVGLLMGPAGLSIARRSAP